MADKKKPKPKKERAKEYDSKLKVNSTFGELVKVAMNPKKSQK